MSRVGVKPVPLPAGVKVELAAERRLQISGPKGKLELRLRPEVEVEIGPSQALVKTLPGGPARATRAYHGLTRALLASAVQGVVKNYEKKLEVVGTGWNASVQGKDVALSVGYSEPVKISIPEGVMVATPSATQIVVFGADKQAVGEMAARLRRVRPPEPYKGKGVRLSDEVVRRKQGKSFGS